MDFPAWYQSSRGPQVSKTIFNIVGSFLPVINLALQSKGIELLPEQVNFWITIGVFLYFSVQATIGYVRSKQTLQAQVQRLQASAGQTAR